MKEKLTELQKIMLEILLEQKDNSMKTDDLIKESYKRQQRIKTMGDLK